MKRRGTEGYFRIVCAFCSRVIQKGERGAAAEASFSVCDRCKTKGAPKMQSKAKKRCVPPAKRKMSWNLLDVLRVKATAEGLRAFSRPRTLTKFSDRPHSFGLR